MYSSAIPPESAAQNIKIIPCLKKEVENVPQAKKKSKVVMRKKRYDLCPKVTEYDDRVERLISKGVNDKGSLDNRMTLKQMRAYREKCFWYKEHNFFNPSSLKI